MASRYQPAGDQNGSSPSRSGSSGRPQSPNSVTNRGRPSPAQRRAPASRAASQAAWRRPYQWAVSIGVVKTRSGSGSIQSFSISGRVGSASRTAPATRRANAA